MTAGDHPASAQEALLALAAEFEREADSAYGAAPMGHGAAYRHAAERARQRAQEHATAASEAHPVSLDGQNGSGDPGAVRNPAYLGEFARVDIMGHDSRTGWVADGSLAGAACLDVRDQVGRLIAKIPPHSVYMYQPVMPGPAPAGELASGQGAGLLPDGDPWKDERDDDGMVRY